MSFLECIGDVNVCASKLEWKISDFLSLSGKKGDYYTSPSFHLSDSSFHLRVCPAGSIRAKSGFISVFLENEYSNSCCLTFTLSIQKSDGTVIKTSTATNANIESTMGYRDFCEKSLLQQSDLILICTLKLNTDEKRDIEKESHLHDKKTVDLGRRQLKEIDELSKNFKDLYANKDSCDVIFQLGNKEFKAHKTILMARSSVFASMFQHDTLEKQTGIIDIPDCDPDSFPLFLEYLYCGCLEDILFDSAFHLYCTSMKYGIQKLKEFCIEYLIGNLAPENVCDIIVLADKYDEMSLLAGTQNYFDVNFSKIVLTTEWINLLKNDHRLANKFLINLSKTLDVSILD